MTTKRLRWGILSTGNIARQFAEGVAGSRRCDVKAVGSRNAATAADFASRFDIDAAHGDYDALIADANIDAVYVALPNSMHHEWTIKALTAGKHVLCEKPFSVNAAEAEQMFDTASKQGLVLVEAFMYRSHPMLLAAVQEVRNGAIGEVTLVRSSFCYCTNKIDGNVRFSSALAGGGIMDVGSYCINFSRLIADAEPEHITATARLHESGVDDIAAGTLRFANGIVANWNCGMRAQTNNAAFICGTEGYIEIPIPWKPPVADAQFTIARMTPPRQDKRRAAPSAGPRTLTFDAPAPLYGMEADDFAAAVFDGAPPRITAQDTLGNMRVLDAIRAAVGLPF